LYTWIYRIVTTRSLNQIKRRKIKSFFSIDEPGEIEMKDSHDIVKELDDKEKIENVKKILEKIPPKQRQIFIMRNFDDLSYEEIAAITGKSIGGLKANYFHALKKVLELANANE
jgi:RNA polymerase sigma-70 factor (ECF subfamily)